MEALEKPQIIIHLEKQMDYTLYDVKWIPCSAKFVVLGSHPKNTGAIQVYELSKGDLKTIHKVFVLPVTSCCVNTLLVYYYYY